MVGKEFQLVAGHLALDFANTLDNRYDRERLLELMPNYEQFLAFATQAGIITGQQARKLLSGINQRKARRTLEAVIEVREALYRLFSSIARDAPPDTSALRTLNRSLERVRIADTIAWKKPAFVRSRDLAKKFDGPLWPIISAAADLLTSPNRRHIRECSEETCRWLFLDRSKNHSRRWCDMRVCGNRSKARRFHARLRGKT